MERKEGQEMEYLRSSLSENDDIIVLFGHTLLLQLIFQ